MLRSKSRWHNKGEKNTKYFLNLEKRHFSKKKNVKHLTSASDNVVNTDSEILKEAKSLYQNLCSSANTQSDTKEENMFFPDGNTLILNEQEQKQCEGFLTASECLKSLKSIESNKSPRSDGLPAEFYKVFWNDINQHLLNALNCASKKGLLSITQRRELITLIPNKNKPTNLLKNWRPITLLNCDYKIATKSTASRIRKVLTKILNNDQTDFLKGRFMGENIRLIDSIIIYTNTEKKYPVYYRLSTSKTPSIVLNGPL